MNTPSKQEYFNFILYIQNYVKPPHAMSNLEPFVPPSHMVYTDLPCHDVMIWCCCCDVILLLYLDAAMLSVCHAFCCLVCHVLCSCSSDHNSQPTLHPPPVVFRPSAITFLLLQRLSEILLRWRLLRLRSVAIAWCYHSTLI